MMKRIGQATIIFLFLISLAVFLTVNAVWLFRLSIPLFNLEGMTGLNTGEMMHDYLKIIGYLQLPWAQPLHFDYFASSPQGLEHFREVRRLVLFNNLVMVLTGIAGFRIFRYLKQAKLLYNLLNPIRVFVVVLIGLAGIMLVNFDQAFIWFHEVFFRNNYWLFDPNKDEVINMLPDGFFALCFLMFGILLAAGIVGLWLAAKHQIKEMRVTKKS